MQKSIHTDRYRRFLELLVAARGEAGLTQAQVAQRLGRHQSFVAKYEGGERRLDVVELIEIAKVLGADPHAILKDLMVPE